MYKRKKRLAKKDNNLKLRKKIFLLLFVFGGLVLVGAVSYNGALMAKEEYQKEEETKMKILEAQFEEAKNKENDEQQADALFKIEEENKKKEAEAKLIADLEAAKQENESTSNDIAYVEENQVVNNSPSLPEEKPNQVVQPVQPAQPAPQPVVPTPVPPVEESNGNGNNMTFLGTLESTAYTHTGSNMANGEYPHIGAVACNMVPLGTKIYIEGLGYFTVKDRIGGGSQIDLFMNTLQECINYGRKTVKVYIVN